MRTMSVAKTIKKILSIVCSPHIEQTHLSCGMGVVPHSCDTRFYFYASRAPTWATFVVIINTESS